MQAPVKANENYEIPQSQALEPPLTLNEDESQQLETPLISGHDAEAEIDGSSNNNANTRPSTPHWRRKAIQNKSLPAGWRIGLDDNKKIAIFDNTGKRMSSLTHSSGSTTQENSSWEIEQALREGFDEQIQESESQQQALEQSSFVSYVN